MSWVQTALIVLLVLSSLLLISLVLIQHGKGADMGAAFGGGASGSLFGATGSANFLSRTTAVAAAVFLLSTIGLAFNATSARKIGESPEAVQGVLPEVSKEAQDALGASDSGAPTDPSEENSAAPKDIPAPSAPAATDSPVPPADLPQ